MENEPKRKNIDYSNSAVNLNNIPLMGEFLENLREQEKELQELQEKANSYIPVDLLSCIEQNQLAINEYRNFITKQIEPFGSYQDLEQGLYAVKQRKVTKSYDAEAFEKKYPQYAPAIIVKSVDTTKLNGLIKGGLLNETDLKHPDIGVITEKEYYSYIIKV